MLGEQLTYVLNDLAYYSVIAAYVALAVIGVICLVAGVIIIMQDDADTVGWVPYPRRVDSDDPSS